ncbi:MAG: hypothetical protein F6K30_18170 [Cyanothece sp. SIO2G6]|nr:hypothetical protein [Cyanothece sp. SIO2G6]
MTIPETLGQHIDSAVQRAVQQVNQNTKNVEQHQRHLNQLSDQTIGINYLKLTDWRAR